MASEESSQQPTPADAESTSALRDNIESKGKNAYYFAHAKTPNGPKWDGKPEPRLLAKHSSIENGDLAESTESMHISHDEAKNLIKSLKQKTATFDFSKSNITKYAFLDDGPKVKIYVELKGVGEICVNDDDISLTWDERSFGLVVRNYKEEGKDEAEVKSLHFGRLHAAIKKASFKKKPDKIIVILTKSEEGDWPNIGAKGDPEHEVV